MKEIVVIALVLVAASKASDNFKSGQENNDFYIKRYASGYRQGDHFDGYQSGGDLYQGYRPYYLGQYARGYTYGGNAYDYGLKYNKRYANGYQQGDHYDAYQNGGDLYEGYRQNSLGQYANGYGYGGTYKGNSYDGLEYNTRYANEYQKGDQLGRNQNKQDLTQIYALYDLVQYLNLIGFGNYEYLKGNPDNIWEDYNDNYTNNIDEHELIIMDNNEI